jgi:ubiquinone/menaquinone biosynthesis C-methylase UbiE
MPDVETNRSRWDGAYAWSEGGGEEWSEAWGGADAQWHSTLLPRLRRFLPAHSILEIAPGYGRWTPYLLDHCERYAGVDLSAECVDACRRRFAEVDHAQFHVGDGRSLTSIDDASIEFAFSFDSLVHVEQDVIGAYLKELDRVLTADGVAFLHHSNLAACRPVVRPLRLALRAAERMLDRETPGFDHWRGTSVSARRFEQLAEDAGLACAGQEIVNWLGGRMIDCMSLVTRPGSRWQRPNTVVHNPYFMAEAASSARAARLYGDHPRPLAVPKDGQSWQHLGSLASITSKSVGPWGISVVGPWRRKQPR